MTISLAVPVDSLKKVRTESYTDCVLWSTLPSEAGRPPWQTCHKGTIVSIAITLPAVASRRSAKTGSQRNMKWGHRLSAIETMKLSWKRMSYSWLQWSHCLSAMETEHPFPVSACNSLTSMGPPPFGDGYLTTPPTRCGTALWLQWGHRLSAMDTGDGPWRPRWRSGCFNGATAFRRWIPGTSRNGFWQSHQRASMGPPPFGDGYLPHRASTTSSR